MKKSFSQPLNLKIVTIEPEINSVIRNLILDIPRSGKLCLEVLYADAVEHLDIQGLTEPSTEHIFKVFSDSWRKVLLLICRTFQDLCLQNEWYGRLSPILVISEQGFFYEECEPAHLNVPLNSLSFGNLAETGIYLSHFTRSPSSNDAEVVKKYLGDDATPMFADFEHDRGTFTVVFAAYGEKPSGRDRDRENKENGQSSLGCLFAIKVKYESIRRIIIDTCVADCDFGFFRMFILLNYPPEIRRLPKLVERNFYSGDRFRSLPQREGDKRDNCAAINDSPMLCLDFECFRNYDMHYRLISRLNARTKIPIECSNIFVSYFDTKSYVELPVKIVGMDYRSCAREEQIRKNEGRYEPQMPKIDLYWSELLNGKRCFGLEYLIAALLTRGAVVKDQILIEKEKRDWFLELVLNQFDEKAEVALEALERLLNFVDETKQVNSLIWTFERILKNLNSDPEILREVLQRNEDGSYARVRKMIVTPTRTLLVVPELLMGNRVLRTFDETGDGALRVQFRDDDGTKLRKNNTGDYLIQTTVHNTLYHGVYISDRHFVYLASSNSQMRDNGCYFFDDGKGGQAQKIRESLGKFDKTNIPKLMSRMGQCFTQAEQCDAVLERKKYNKVHDFIGGKDANGNPYIFSDGVGKLSCKFACEIAQKMDMGSCVPSCFQIRYRGVKGVLSVDPAMDERRLWAKNNGVQDSTKVVQKTLHLDVLFRPSQDKFNAPRNSNIEIVKHSSPVPVCLNRPLICIMDQVSEMQGYELHTTVCGRIHALLDRQLMQMAEMLMSEDKCRDRLNELPRRISVDCLSTAKGFALTQEPFFRTLLHASAKFILKKQLMKEQIQIPVNLGRSMFGIVDETGLLQYGQVFIQYTYSIELKTPGKNAAKIILKGKVLITKNPSVVAGDVRVFEAVDIPELRHLVDVVVFPQSGPRPHPDEMAGSDLDGDEYSIMWDPELFFDHNEEPLDFTKDARDPQDISQDAVVAAMRNFFVEYIKQDSIGSISNAFLINADLYGIKSEVCKSIARKHSQSVDFPKTGCSPAPLIKKWGKTEDGVPVPPEKPERFPDFMCKNHEPFYASRRLVGQLFRRIKAVDDVLNLTMTSEGLGPIKIDESLLYPGYKSFRRDAEKDFAAYSAYITSLMDNYGIEDEGQLYSGCIIVLRNRLSERDNDDMSLFNTNYMIEKKVTDIFRIFRKAFFDQFGGFEACTTSVNTKEFIPFDKDLRRVCKESNDEMKAKAAAYYYVCYDRASQTSGRRLLSFPWLVWDILAQIKLSNQSFRSSFAVTVDPLSALVTEFIDRYCSQNETSMVHFIKILTTGSSGSHALLRYCRKYAGLDKLIFVVYDWANHHGLLSGRFNPMHLSLLLIKFLVGHFVISNFKVTESLLAQVDELQDSDEVISLKSLVGGIGKLFIRFLQFLSSRNFENLKYIDFSQPNLDYQSKMIRGQWLELHKAALKSFYRLMLKGRFDELPLNEVTSQEIRDIGITEMDPFVIEIPENIRISDKEMHSKMLRYTGVTYLALRRVSGRKGKVVISAKGSLESLRRLRELVTVESVTDSQISDEEKSNMMVRLVYERIVQFCS